MLFAHMAAVEDQLLATSKIPANSGHSLHKGTPREAFIKEFLEAHLPSTLAIGSGELIDSESQPAEPRRQFDLVIYKRSLPKLDFGGGISGFLAESVVATIEVKSTLDKAGMQQAITAARAAKQLKKCETWSFSSGYVPPAILSFVVAYAGPQQMETVLNWITEIEAAQGIAGARLPVGEERIRTPSQSIDGAFLLGTGFVTFDNFPVGFLNDDVRSSAPDTRWVAASATHGSLLWLFQMLTQASMNINGTFLNMVPYMNKLRVDIKTGG
ncbi:DUF6602 domain-containing protein [Paraburkholderia sp. BL9I2N2]|jgi:hypothetical protein|uniref:DUF6602 domain-containing protein n=1 Tax=Paraburkholderia sp. BL9I2N2 TaxID=1938809 RepID=UPI001051C08C|nr:DUF6602 domain-containing protein [Paraburkholderia sp. BL9I2N2]TCK95577.1 hypothetical protein B0G74_2204 [Paraburkholderia sp. BL9I2N2]